MNFIKNQSKLNCFSDASENSYGYCLYLGEDFLFGRSKIASSIKSIVEKEWLVLVELI